MVVGPGLGKDELMVRTVGAWLGSQAQSAAAAELQQGSEEAAASRAVAPVAPVAVAPVVLDGDGIHVLQQHPELVGAPLMAHVVLTPNAMEFRRLWTSFVDDKPPPFDLAVDEEAWLRESQ